MQLQLHMTVTRHPNANAVVLAVLGRWGGGNPSALSIVMIGGRDRVRWCVVSTHVCGALA